MSWTRLALVALVCVGGCAAEAADGTRDIEGTDEALQRFATRAACEEQAQRSSGTAEEGVVEGGCGLDEGGRSGPKGWYPARIIESTFACVWNSRSNTFDLFRESKTTRTYGVVTVHSPTLRGDTRVCDDTFFLRREYTTDYFNPCPGTQPMFASRVPLLDRFTDAKLVPVYDAESHFVGLDGSPGSGVYRIGYFSYGDAFRTNAEAYCNVPEPEVTYSDDPAAGCLTTFGPEIVQARDPRDVPFPNASPSPGK